MLYEFFYNITCEFVRSKSKREYDMRFDLLDQSPFLHSSKYLNELYESAKSKQDFNVLLEHIYKSQAEEIDSYQEIEKKIINKYWV